MVTKLFPNVIEFASDFPQAIIEVVTRKDGLKENQPVFWILDKIINLFRSIPFIILIPTVAVLSRALFGTTIGIEGALAPLVIGTAPFVARQMESAIMEIDPGIIEASIAMGLSTNTNILEENIMNKNILKVFTAGLLAFSLAGCGSKSDSKTITVGATTSPHAIILKHVQPEFEKAGYKLKIKEFSDYPNINPSTSDGSLDANFFQHQPYLRMLYLTTKKLN